MARTWFGEILSCSSLTVLLGLAWVLWKQFFRALYMTSDLRRGILKMNPVLANKQGINWYVGSKNLSTAW